MKGKHFLSVGLVISCIVIFMLGCSNEKKEENSYQMMDMDVAKKIFEEEGDYIILDVRHADEYAEGHIKGAVNIDNDMIGTEEIKELPSKEQTIYVYCRSGNRSKQAAKKL
ncbi:MAG: rhodanese-like domain-containing protein, partial [Lachnospiraceae bacterium]|nr:rhodanese-like domain-containing protein [Lachnospiraceae bacterium]